MIKTICPCENFMMLQNYGLYHNSRSDSNKMTAIASEISKGGKCIINDVSADFVCG